eukprot:TRINITY_DN5122_c3_g1_i1.p4 TRINITY_DN5122_c3_g1~~TRINITY_DN5122_c3_g1_i1.p4  ORF type:complete len:126 (-),score=5.09 TRINITY_DN5122_c3_g1_i1:808-1185(-)
MSNKKEEEKEKEIQDDNDVGMQLEVASILAKSMLLDNSVQEKEIRILDLNDLWPRSIQLVSQPTLLMPNNDRRKRLIHKSEIKYVYFEIINQKCVFLYMETLQNKSFIIFVVKGRQYRTDRVELV